MVLEATITIECFLVVWTLQSMVFQWFLVLLPSLSMVFDGFGPLVKRCDGFDGSSWSNNLIYLTIKSDTGWFYNNTMMMIVIGKTCQTDSRQRPLVHPMDRKFHHELSTFDFSSSWNFLRGRQTWLEDEDAAIWLERMMIKLAHLEFWTLDFSSSWNFLCWRQIKLRLF